MQASADTRAVDGELPLRLSSFVGRQRERSEVVCALNASRLLTLTGVGGCGKTSLALEVARDVVSQFRDGAHWIELSQIDDAATVPTAIARSVGCRPVADESELDAAVRLLAGRQALVILDNCEHLVAGCATIARRLLLQCPGVKVLATSSVPLGIEGEEIGRASCRERV